MSRQHGTTETSGATCRTTQAQAQGKNLDEMIRRERRETHRILRQQVKQMKQYDKTMRELEVEQQAIEQRLKNLVRRMDNTLHVFQSRRQPCSNHQQAVPGLFSFLHERAE